MDVSLKWSQATAADLRVGDVVKGRGAVAQVYDETEPQQKGRAPLRVVLYGQPPVGNSAPKVERVDLLPPSRKIERGRLVLTAA